MPHLELFTTHDALAARLGVQVTDVAGLLRGNGDHSLGDHGDRVLRETGRLLASAVDTGVRLYDPEAVFVSGPISDSDIVWDALREEAHLATSERRSLIRARDLATDTDGPIGLQGGATLALDTWVYPHALAALRRGPRHSADVRP